MIESFTLCSMARRQSIDERGFYCHLSEWQTVRTVQLLRDSSYQKKIIMEKCGFAARCTYTATDLLMARQPNLD